MVVITCAGKGPSPTIAACASPRLSRWTAAASPSTVHSSSLSAAARTEAKGAVDAALASMSILLRCLTRR